MGQKTIGIVGGGQLGRMLTQAAHNLNFKVIVLDPNPSPPAGDVADGHILGDFKDEAKILELAESSDFLTFETELANSAALEKLQSEGKSINPSPATLSIIKNKFAQKQFLSEAKIPVAEFMEVNSTEDILRVAHEFDYPVVLKAKFDSYDGRGNALIEDESQIKTAFTKLGGKELYVEKFAPFQKELAVVAARSQSGDISIFPLVETVHKNHICHTVTAPANVSDNIKLKARDLAIKTLQHLKGVGVFAIEMFLVGEDLLVNEIAPRVHNSGHLTIEACQTSQFEQHIRAITGMELGPTSLTCPASVMINILGEKNGKANFKGFDGTWENFAKTYNLPAINSPAAIEIFVHIYGKIETRVERKMGHITVLADDIETALGAGQQARNLIEI